MPYIDESEHHDYLLEKTEEWELPIDVEPKISIERLGLRFNIKNAEGVIIQPDLSINALMRYYAHTMYGMDYRRRKAEGTL